MSTQAIVTLNTGQVVRAVSYRMSPGRPPAPSVPASPTPYMAGGMYHLETPMGWVDIPASQVQNISVSHGALT